MQGAVLTLWVHDRSFSNHDVIINEDLVPGLSASSAIEIRQTGYESSPKLLGLGGKQMGISRNSRRLFAIPTFLEGDLKKKQSNLQISISTTLSAAFGLRNRIYVKVTIVEDKMSISADYIVIYFKDQYISRSDMWNLSQDLQGKCIWKREKMIFSGSLRADIREIWINGKKKHSAYVSTKTKPIFRSESAKCFLFLQMSKEMWEFEEDGELFFDKAIDGFLPELFKRWKNMGTRHSVTIILFTRVYYDGIGPFCLSQSQENYCSSQAQKIIRNYKDYYETCSKYSQDFFKIVFDNVFSGECMTTISELKQELQKFKKDVLMYERINELSHESMGLVSASMSYALQGNVLEAINIVTKQFCYDYIDHDLIRTGASIVIVTPGTGHFEVDEKMLEITAKNLISTGIEIDFICLSKPPLHIVPLFRYKKKSSNEINNSQDADNISVYPSSSLNLNMSNKNLFSSLHQHESWVYAVPYFCQVSYWNYKTKKNTSFVTSCKMHELQMMGIMENEASKIAIEYLPEFDLLDDGKISSYCEEYDENVFRINRKDNNSLNNEHLDEKEKILKNRSFSQKTDLENISTLNDDVKKQAKYKESDKEPFSVHKKVDKVASKAHTLSKRYFVQNILSMGELFSSQYLKALPSITSVSFLATQKKPTTKKLTTKSNQLESNETDFLISQNNPQYPYIFQSRLDSKKDSIKNKINTIMSKQPEKIMDIRKSLSLEKFQKLKPEKDSFWQIIQYPSNPLSNPPPSDVYYKKWKDAHPKQRNIEEVNWSSICSPASLPLSTDLFPSAEELRELYQDYTYTITIDPEKVSFDQHSLLIELINLRLNQGFQIVIGDSVLADDPKSIILSQHSPVCKLNKKNTLQGPLDNFYKTIYLALDNYQFHKITGDFSGYNIQVKRFIRKYSPIGPINYKYHTWFLSNSGYQPRSITFSSHPFENQNWNYVDQLIAGQEDNLSDSIKYWRSRFVLIPVDIKTMPVHQILTYFNANSTDVLTDEEIRILGILKIYELIKKGQYLNSFERDRIKHTSWKDGNNMDLIFITSNIPAFIIQEIESFDSEYNFQNKENSNTGNEKLKTLDAKLNSIAQEIQGPRGIKFQDRRWHLKLYENCFIGMDMVTWLLENFSDISTREEAVYYGNELLSKGLFEHVNNDHQFLDGYFFYRLKPEYSSSKTPKCWFGTRKITPINAVSGNLSRSDSIASNYQISTSTKKIQKVILSKYLIYDVDTQKQSYRPECIRLHYDRIYNPKSCYHIRLEWVSVTSRFVENTIQSWKRIAEKYGLKLVEVPIDEACKINDKNPLQSTISIKLVLPPPPVPHLIKSDEILGEDPDFWCILLLRKFDFVLDFESASKFPKSIDITYSWGKPSYKYSQYIHRSGAAIAQIADDNTILWLTNQLYLSRIGFMVHAPNQYNIESQRNIKDLTLESNKLCADFIKFCSDKVSLEKFYEEILAKYTLKQETNESE
ncbi:hypothetical protein PNEG_02942 [Pneumocystis murina B123]|uniref:Vacuolar membrane-associated protein IML1 n=1 Tax=Pneumocystis murina (strain B123) TaxID=1069680 RepID=M7NNV6_PNEMU|nr:hypothetical protein PNEG_02942 [Pneumocystis murina B123]EMR08771.1 hypothetical protein PNEG_02942 [Pneumocystis murina B123]